MLDEPLQILLVEDDPADIFMAEEMFNDRSGLQLNVVDNGEDALAYLEREGDYQRAPQPAMILLDLNIPGVDGREVLSRIKQDESLRRIPVIVMSTSDAPDDVDYCYHNGANCFITKPVGIDAFEEMVDQFEYFWCKFARLPGRS